MQCTIILDGNETGDCNMSNVSFVMEQKLYCLVPTVKNEKRNNSCRANLSKRKNKC